MVLSMSRSHPSYMEEVDQTLSWHYLLPDPYSTEEPGALCMKTREPEGKFEGRRDPSSKLYKIKSKPTNNTDPLCMAFLSRTPPL